MISDGVIDQELPRSLDTEQRFVRHELQYLRIGIQLEERWLMIFRVLPQQYTFRFENDFHFCRRDYARFLAAPKS